MSSKKKKDSKKKNLLTMVPKRIVAWRRMEDDSLKKIAKRERKGVVIPGVEVRHEWIKDAHVVLYQKKEYAGWEQKLASMLGKDDVGRVWLDDYGASVWLLIDGKRNAEAIGVQLKKEYGDDVEPLYQRLGDYLGVMEKNKLITFGKKKKTTKKQGKKVAEKTKK